VIAGNENGYKGLVEHEERIIEHSFIHIEHLYIASSREQLRGAPDSRTQVTRLYGKSEVEKGAHSRSRDQPGKKRGF